jgi:hypothetical protein
MNEPKVTMKPEGQPKAPESPASILCKLANVPDNRANRRKMAKLAGLSR